MRKLFVYQLCWIVAATTMVVLATTITRAQGAQDIEYNTIYDCPTRGGYGRMQFKVLSCADNDWCQVFLVNNSPEGGYKDEWKRSEVLEYLKKKDNNGKGCTVGGRPVTSAKPAAPTTKKDSTGKAAPRNDAKAKTATSTSCASVAPPGKVTRNAKPSAALFKRVIYERYRMMDKGRPVGMSFTAFRLERSYVNRLTNDGLLHDGAPRNATVYRYKTNYTHCVKYTDSIIRWDVTDAYYSCFKDKAGDWACTSEGERDKKQSYLPVE